MSNSTQHGHSGVSVPDAGSTPKLKFFQAAVTDDLRTLKLCARKENVPLTSRDHENSTAAHIAAKHGSLMSLKYLLEKCPTLLLETDARGKTVLHVAVAPDQPKILRYLLDTMHIGMYLRCSTPSQDTIIHEAAAVGALNVLRYLHVEKKANLEVRNEHGQTPIFSAVANGQDRIVKYLLDEGEVDPTVTDNDGDTVLFPMVCNGTMKVFNCFRNRGIYFDVNSRNKRGESALHRAVNCGRFDFVKHLVGVRSTDLEVEDNKGRTALYEAARSGNVDIVRFLVSMGAQVNSWAADGTRPVDVAKSPEVLQCLEARTAKSAARVRREVARYADPIVDVERSEVGQHLALSSDNQGVPSSNLGSPQVNAFLVFASACIRYIFRS